MTETYGSCSRCSAGPAVLLTECDTLRDALRTSRIQRDALLVACRTGLAVIEVLELLVTHGDGKSPSDKLLRPVDDAKKLIASAIAAYGELPDERQQKET